MVAWAKSCGKERADTQAFSREPLGVPAYSLFVFSQPSLLTNKAWQKTHAALPPPPQWLATNARVSAGSFPKLFGSGLTVSICCDCWAEVHLAFVSTEEPTACPAIPTVVTDLEQVLTDIDEDVTQGESFTYDGFQTFPFSNRCFYFDGLLANLVFFLNGY